jgi:hypothetical protein
MRPTAPPKNEDRRAKAREYRARAEGLADRATAMHTPEVRVAYLELAQQWAALAEHVGTDKGAAAAQAVAREVGRRQTAAGKRH